jgi:hypothetical protein
MTPVFEAREPATPSGAIIHTVGDRVRRDKVDRSGLATVRHRGASKNRTCDLSIISSFHGDELQDARRLVAFPVIQTLLRPSSTKNRT